MKEQLKVTQAKGKKHMEETEVYNAYGFYKAEYCKATGLPMYTSKDKYEGLYTLTQCKKMKKPVLAHEEPAAFYRVKHGYCGLYPREV